MAVILTFWLFIVLNIKKQSLFKICVILQLLKSLHIEVFIQDSTFAVQVLTKIIISITLKIQIKLICLFLIKWVRHFSFNPILRGVILSSIYAGGGAFWPPT